MKSGRVRSRPEPVPASMVGGHGVGGGWAGMGAMYPLVQGVDLIQPGLQCRWAWVLRCGCPTHRGLMRDGSQLSQGLAGQQRQLLVQQRIGVHGVQVGKLFWGGPSLGQGAQQFVNQPADRGQALLTGRGWGVA